MRNGTNRATTDKMLGASDAEVTPTPKGLYTDLVREWYTNLSPRIIDIVGDFAGRELFVVEGDSLLDRCLNDELLDYGKKDGKHSTGYQLLHLVFIVETFLRDLIKRRCNFHVVFFEGHRIVSCGVDEGDGTIRMHPARCFARSVIIRHLQALDDLEVFVFGDARDVEWERYLSSQLPLFVMCNDGSCPQHNTLEQSTLLKRFVLVAFILSLHRRNVHAALLDYVTFRDSKVVTFVLETNHMAMLAPSAERINQRIERWIAHVAQSQAILRSEPDVHALLSTVRKHTQTKLVQCERRAISIASCIHYLLANQGREARRLVKTFLLHTALLEVLPLSYRSLPVAKTEDGSQTESLLRAFLNSIMANSTILMTAVEFNELSDKCGLARNLADFLDGRVIWNLVHALSSVDVNDRLVPKEVLAVAQLMWDAVRTHVAGIEETDAGVLQDLKWAAIHLRDIEYIGPPTSQETFTYHLLPFSHPALDEFLPSLNLPVLPPSNDVDNKINKFLALPQYPHKETFHWHSKKPIDQKFFQRRLRSDQIFMRQFTNYAASLTGAKGKLLEQITIGEGNESATAVKQKRTKSEPEQNRAVTSQAKTNGKGAPTKDVKAGKQSKTPKMSKADMIRAENLARKAKKTEEKSGSLWSLQVQTLEQTSLDKRLQELESLLAKAKTLDPFVRTQMELYKVLSLLRIWSEKCGEEGDLRRDMTPVVTLFRAIMDMYADKSLVLTPNIDRYLTKTLKAIGLVTCRPSSSSVSLVESDDRKIEFKFPVPDKKALHIGCSPIIFQLEHCGPTMERTMDSAPDDRVAFEPDAWQRRVLDCLDQNESVFVCAPTSAGKTFIAYYAMEQILRKNSDDILVYVAPTKALVNQIAAEVHARYNKKYKHAGKSVWAIHTRDYRINDPMNCQILITVPQILQILFLSPELCEKWSPRVKKIIFDEIHCIGEMEGGAVWEQLLLLSYCPIVALSATVGNPVEFEQWLAKAQACHGIKLQLIHHKHRYSDLRKFIYTPTNSGKDALTFVHPVSALPLDATSLPHDLPLEPRDCLLLYQAMKAAARTQEDEECLRALDPDRYFAKKPYIRKADCLRYEEELKTVMRRWMANNAVDGAPAYRQVVQALGRDTTSAMRELDRSRASKGTECSLYGREFCEDTIYHLCRDLQRKDMLPAIFFLYDRHGCDTMAKKILHELEEAERKKRESDPKWKEKVQKWEEWQKNARARAKAEEKQEKATKKKSKEEEEQTSNGSSWLESFDPEDPDPEFSFAGKKGEYSKAELMEDIKRLRWVVRGSGEGLLTALRRGVAVHHAGMNKRYLQLVEMLFRKKFLRVVIATGTLALGINMPCKTVGFIGDSVFLTLLNYRQASGRAGRRGFDNLGNVIFQGIPLAKVHRLLTSRLPDISGHFPLTTTLVLRLLQMLIESDNSKHAQKSIRGLLSQSFVYLGGDDFKDQVSHHLRFSIEYLRREGLIDRTGHPLDLAGCVTHLFYTEPANFAFIALFRRKYFHKLCAEFDSDSEATYKKMLVVLSHLFARRERRASDKEFIEEVVKKSPSIVLLPPLDDEALEILKEHDERILEIYGTYVKTFVQEKTTSLAPDNELPLSRLALPTTVPSGEMELLSHLKRISNRNQSRSAFVALSGHNDVFTTIPTLVSSARSGVHLNETSIPSMSSLIDSKVVLDAYIYDYFNHQQVEALVRDHGIRRGEIWFVLDAFLLALKSIRFAMRSWLCRFNDSVMQMLESLDDEGNGDDEEALRPEGVDVETWRVYRAFAGLEKEFLERFKKMWA